MGKTIHDLTIRDNFMFAAVMLEEDNCKEFLEMVLGVEIERIDVNIEHTLVYHPDFHGIRLDVFTKDNVGTHYNIEMQVAKDDIPKRTRYYHSHMDMDMLLKGTDYEVLPNSYVIFICDFDPIGSKKYQYTIHHRIDEDPEAVFEDGSYTILLSTKGENHDEVSPSLVEFLRFVATDTKSQDTESSSTYVKKLQNSILKIKADRTRGEQFMLLEEMLKKSKKEGFAEGEAVGYANGEAVGYANGEAVGYANGEAVGYANGEAVGYANGEARGLKQSLHMILNNYEKPIPSYVEKIIDEANDADSLNALIKNALTAKSLEDFIKLVTVK